jgi:hypothetical protein
VVVRLCQPSSGPCLPTITCELVRMLSEVPAELQQDIRGGDLFVHTEQSGQLVRLRVEQGGELRIAWAHPDYARAERRPWSEDRAPLVDPKVQRLNGCVTLQTAAPRRAARDLEQLADTYEGLYPEGEFVVTADERRGRVQLIMHDLNVDVKLLLECLQQLALPGTLAGRIEVSSFAAAAPDLHARFLIEDGAVWVQRPLLWREPAADQRESVSA